MAITAKKIQLFLEIPKHRYEYLASKIGIKPPKSGEVEGSGRAHSYSSKSIFQFAYAHQSSGLGLTPKAVRKVLSLLDNHKDAFDPDKEIDMICYYIKDSKSTCYVLTDEGTVVEATITYSDTIMSGHPDPKDRVEMKKGKTESLSINEAGLRECLKNADGYLVVNIGKIKEKILRKLG